MIHSIEQAIDDLEDTNLSMKIFKEDLVEALKNPNPEVLEDLLYMVNRATKAMPSFTNKLML